ncbi:MAG TPA: alpha/beta fold hydrolase [Blastocatellia bacterium]|nr:alpha/beta fold hydrolase [Blastocatellia bacterium]
MAYADRNGFRIYWEEHGQGPPLLLIMGLGYTLEMWHRATPVVSTRYRTIVFDNRGVGRTEAPPGPYTIREMADDAAAVLEAAGVERAHVFGISMGGMIAQELALAHPQRVWSLILGCTDCGGREAVRASAEVLRMLDARATMTPEEGVWAMVPYIYDGSTPRSRIEEDLAIRLRTFPKAESYLAQLQGVRAWGSHDRLRSLRVPTLVIHGESDQLVPPENARILARAIPGSSLVLLPSASHIFPTDQPEAAHEAILSFLQSVDRAAAVPT